MLGLVGFEQGRALATCCLEPRCRAQGFSGIETDAPATRGRCQNQNTALSSGDGILELSKSARRALPGKGRTHYDELRP